MAVKTITITEEAYDSMKRLKSGGESFSDLFLRLTSKTATVKDIRGFLHHSPEEAAEFARRVRAVHEGLGKSLGERIEYVRTRLKRTY